MELADDVKHVSITGKDSKDNVVLRQELSEGDLNQATGGIDLSSMFGGVMFDAKCPPASY